MEFRLPICVYLGRLGDDVSSFDDHKPVSTLAPTIKITLLMIHPYISLVLLDSVKDRAPKRYVLDAYYSLYSYRYSGMKLRVVDVFVIAWCIVTALTSWLFCNPIQKIIYSSIPGTCIHHTPWYYTTTFRYW